MQVPVVLYTVLLYSPGESSQRGACSRCPPACCRTSWGRPWETDRQYPGRSHTCGHQDKYSLSIKVFRFENEITLQKSDPFSKFWRKKTKHFLNIPLYLIDSVRNKIWAGKFNIAGGTGRKIVSIRVPTSLLQYKTLQKQMVGSDIKTRIQKKKNIWIRKNPVKISEQKQPNNIKIYLTSDWPRRPCPCRPQDHAALLPPFPLPHCLYCPCCCSPSSHPSWSPWCYWAWQRRRCCAPTGLAAPPHTGSAGAPGPSASGCGQTCSACNNKVGTGVVLIRRN